MIRKSSVSLFTIAMLAGAAVLCQAQPQTLLTNHVRDAVTSGEAHFLNRMPAEQTMRLNIILQLRDRAGLQSYIKELYDPNSSVYHHYLTVQDFTNMFGPTQADYDSVVQFAKSHGFQVVGGSRDAFDVQISGPASAVESAFHVNMNVYQHPTENRKFYAPDRQPSVDLPFQLWAVSGLDNYSIPHTALHTRAAGAHSLATTGSCPQKSFCGSDMRGAYYQGTALTGAGQNIGLLEYAGFDIADVNTYYANAGQTRTYAVTGISTDGTSVNCFANQGCDDTEQTIDITQAGGMAPGVTTIYEYVGSTDTAILGAMTTDTPLPLNLSSSWYWSPPDPNTDDPYFEKMQSQGQSFFEAAGDSGAWESKNTWYPMEDPNVICVGGTDLTTTGPGGPWASETVWVDGGGGISPDHFAIPSWQQLPGVITTENKGSTLYRNGPDVTANANFTFYVCADQEACTANLYGGTSFAAPMWAGYLALTNQQAVTNGTTAPGFINPTIYPLGLGSTYGTDFWDITSGSNGFPATVGYDLASGWGSPKTDGLINALTQVSASFSLSANPATIHVEPGGLGTTTITSAIAGNFDSSVTLTASMKMVKFKPATIPAPGSGTSTMGIEVPAGTKAGTYTITVTGSGGGLTETTTVTLDVE